MNKHESDPVDDLEIQFRPRKTEMVALSIPVDTLQALQRVAERRDMSLQGVLKLYIGQGLRHDLAQFFGDQVLDKTAQVLTRYVESPDEVASILNEIRTEISATTRLETEK